ncbi:hypothetical protein LTR04_001342 [Oleoguttula sp. CCFEE 6159]|nr:hypothetical protein LTR04_001342 [Oleoguttula sp. CCFEE 6159]
MDDWGSPWADEVEDNQPATTLEVGPSGKAATTGIDDIVGAPWGDDVGSEDFGGWTSFTDVEADTIPANRRVAFNPDQSAEVDLGTAFEDLDFEQRDNAWADGRTSRVDTASPTQEARPTDPTLASTSAGVADVSDTASSIKLNSQQQRIPIFGESEDNSSSRPSMALSDVSQIEIAVQESARTSFGDDSATPHVFKQEEAGIEIVHEDTDSARVREADDGGDEFGGFGDFEGEIVEGEEHAEYSQHAEASLENVERSTVGDLATGSQTQAIVQRTSQQEKERLPVPAPSFDVDLSLIHNIYPTRPTEDAVPAASEHTLSSAGASRAWYRISRAGPMRKRNSGDEENYVRVTWAGSKIQAEVNKIVPRWASEDCNNGGMIEGGGGGHAIFGWGRPAESQHATRPASRHRGHGPVPTPGIKSDPRRMSLKTEGPREMSIGEDSLIAKFDWSSPPAAVKSGMSGESAMTQSDPKSAISSKRSFLDQRGHEKSAPIPLDPLPGRGHAALEYSERPKGTDPASMSRVIANTLSDSEHATKSAVDKVQSSSDSWANLGRLNTSLPANFTTTSIDDDWGEMVQFPALPAHTSDEAPLPMERLTPSLVPEYVPSLTITSVPSIRENADSKIFTEDVTELPSSDLPNAVLSSQEHPIEPELRANDSVVDSVASTSDPWASVDFSVFDAPAAPPESLPQTNAAVLQHGTTPFTGSIRSSFSSSILAPNTPVSAPPIPPKSKHVEDDEAVRNIVSQLANLSYMLRR